MKNISFHYFLCRNFFKNVFSTIHTIFIKYTEYICYKNIFLYSQICSYSRHTLYCIYILYFIYPVTPNVPLVTTNTIIDESTLSLGPFNYEEFIANSIPTVITVVVSFIHKL